MKVLNIVKRVLTMLYKVLPNPTLLGFQLIIAKWCWLCIAWNWTTNNIS